MGRVWRDDEEERAWLARTREVMNTEQAKKDLRGMGRVIIAIGLVWITLIAIMVNL